MAGIIFQASPALRFHGEGTCCICCCELLRAWRGGVTATERAEDEEEVRSGDNGGCGCCSYCGAAVARVLHSSISQLNVSRFCH